MKQLPDLWFDATKCFINGEWVAPIGGEQLALTDPSTGVEIGSIARGKSADIDAAVAAAEDARHGEWGRMPAFEKGRILNRLGRLILTKTEELARLEAIDVGKPLTQARNDVIAMARYMEFYAGAADKVHGETIPYLDGYTVYTMREPHGVTGHIVPWNYPMQIIGRSVGGALTMGNTCVLKPAEEACLTALAFADLARQAGLPKGVLNVVPGLGAEAGKSLSNHRGIHHMSFTGSVGTGQSIQSAAAQNVIPVTLELGGNAACIVDADQKSRLDKVIERLVFGAFYQSGQSCIGVQRILIHKDIYDELKQRLITATNALVAGDPRKEDTFIGPMISTGEAERLDTWIQEAVRAGGKLLCGGKRDGAMLDATLLEGVPLDQDVCVEEAFGPVAVLSSFTDFEAALAQVDDSKFGLQAGIFTNDLDKAMHAWDRLDVGGVVIGDVPSWRVDNMPYGGVKDSGLGREGVKFAMEDMTEIRNLVIRARP